MDELVAARAQRQCGAISRAQAIGLGIDDSAIRRRLKAGRWNQAYPGVYVIAGTPRSWAGDLWCALLAVSSSAVVSHETALRLHGVDCVPNRPFTFTIPHGKHSRVPTVVAHQIDDLQPHRVTTVNGLPVSTPARAVVEVAATLGTRQLRRVVDEVLVARQAKLAQIAACLQEVMRPGKPGARKLGTVLDDLGDGYVPPQSELERAMFAALTAGGLPEPRRQFPLPGRSEIRGLVDAAYLDARLIIEADGRRWHTRIDNVANDRRRDRQAAREGWLTIRFVYEEIMRDPAGMCHEVAVIRAERLRK